MPHKAAKLIQAVLEWYAAYENYAKTPSDPHEFVLFAANIKLLTAARDYKGE